jgi:septum formation inhibitor-activating ATPase MinD
LAQVERVYPQGFAAVLPYATEVTRSINAGKPVITTAPRSEISTRYIDGATRLVPPATGGVFTLPGTEPQTRSWLRRLFERRKGAVK